jgi:CheY-like chemotaxis protein
MALPRTLLQGWNVLVVDDEPDSLEVAVRILRFYSASVITGNNGREGIELAKAHRPRLIISDISMPVADGWELIFELKNNLATRDIPAIALTAHAMVGDRQRAIEAGFHNYITKPLTAANFIRDLLRVLEDIPEFEQAFKEIADV